MLRQDLCKACEGTGYSLDPRHRRGSNKQFCTICDGAGYRSALGLLEPTDALPGSVAKANVLRLRADHGIPLHHPKDAKGYGGPPK